MAIVENWLPVIGYEGTYDVSDLGRVRRVGRATRSGKGRGGGARIGRILRTQVVHGGYRTVHLWLAGSQKVHLVAGLVAEAFIGPRPIGREVNHIDGVKKNNAAANLEYLTRSENLTHAYQLGLRSRSVEHMVAVRRKPRRIVACACGCETPIETPDRKGRERTFVSGHNRRSTVQSF